MASIHPGPTCAQGTSPMPRWVPRATAGDAAGAFVVEVAGPLGFDWPAVGFDTGEQPARNSDVVVATAMVAVSIRVTSRMLQPAP
jgi:hypothetical protein